MILLLCLLFILGISFKTTHPGEGIKILCVAKYYITATGLTGIDIAAPPTGKPKHRVVVSTNPSGASDETESRDENIGVGNLSGQSSGFIEH